MPRALNKKKKTVYIKTINKIKVHVKGNNLTYSQVFVKYIKQKQARY